MLFPSNGPLAVAYGAASALLSQGCPILVLTTLRSRSPRLLSMPRPPTVPSAGRVGAGASCFGYDGLDAALGRRGLHAPARARRAAVARRDPGAAERPARGAARWLARGAAGARGPQTL